MAVLKVMQLIVIGVCIVPFVSHGSLESYAANTVIVIGVSIVPFVSHGSLESYAANSNRSMHCSLCKSWPS